MEAREASQKSLTNCLKQFNYTLFIGIVNWYDKMVPTANASISLRKEVLGYIILALVRQKGRFVLYRFKTLIECI